MGPGHPGAGPAESIPSATVLGVRVHLAGEDALLDILERFAEGPDQSLVTYTHFHVLLEARDHPSIAALLNAADVNHPDGVGMAWALRRLLRAATPVRAGRVNGSDLYPRLVERLLAGGKRIFFLGGDGRTERALRGRWPEHSASGVVAAMHGGYATGDEAPAAAIADACPDALFVGLGSPKQYAWLERHRSRVPARLIILAGNGVEFLAGTHARAPRALRAAGLEWLWRLAREPGRLWKRYLLGIPRFVTLVLRESRRLRRSHAT